MEPTCVIALVEPYWIGHPETQLRLFTETLLKDPRCLVVVLCTHPEVIQSWIQSAHPKAAGRCFTAPFSFCTQRGDHPNASLASWAQMHQSLLAVERSLGRRVDKVFITWLDPFICDDADLVADLMPRPWAGLYLFPTYLRQRRLLLHLLRLKRPKRMRMEERFFATRHCTGLSVLDEGVRWKLSSVASRTHVHALPDIPDTALPASIPALVHSLLDKAAGRPIIGLLGVLGRRKGTLPFLKAMLETDPASCFYLLAGRLGPEECKTYGTAQAELDALLVQARERDNTFLHLEHIATEEAFNALVAVCSILYLAYDDHLHSSGILGKAAHFHKLVIAANTGCIAERVRRYRMGVTVKAGSTPDIVEAIRSLTTGSCISRRMEAAHFSGYLARHNRQALATTLHALMEKIH